MRVEPKVSIDQLQRALLPLGYTLPVVPEIGDLQIGGLVLGAGISSSSAKNGLFQHSCLAYEIVTTSGELITAERVDFKGYLTKIKNFFKGRFSSVIILRHPLVARFARFPSFYHPQNSRMPSIYQTSIPTLFFNERIGWAYRRINYEEENRK